MPYTSIDLANRRNLPLPDGRRADALRLGELQAELQKLKIPGLRPDMGKDVLLGIYEEQVTAAAWQYNEPKMKQISDAAITRAVAELAKAAAMSAGR